MPAVDLEPEMESGESSERRKAQFSGNRELSSTQLSAHNLNIL